MKLYLATLVLCLLCGSLFSQNDTIRQARQDTTFVKKKLDTLMVGASKSDYDQLTISGGVNSVDADLVLDDEKKDAWLDYEFNWLVTNEYYNTKRFLKRKLGLAVGVDYMFLHQFASFSFEEQNATSGIFRFFGNWTAPWNNSSNRGSFIFKIENRHKIGTGGIPRELGYSAGAALSTASFKEFQWGLTNFYWKQTFDNNKYALIFGIMDPGDWLDLYPFLNPYKYYLSEAFFNSPAMALPNQGLGIVGSIRDFIPGFYIGGGLHDANGEPTKWVGENFDSFFSDKEYMYWIETGWSPNPNRPLTDGRTIHLMYWHQDARIAQQAPGEEVEESWGLNFSASTRIIDRKYTVFLRAGYAEGNGARMRHLIQSGISWKVIKHDRIGIGVHWGAPSDLTVGNQAGLEAFYALQLTENLNIMPDFQLTFNPSFNDQKDVVGVFSTFRIRYAL